MPEESETWRRLALRESCNWVERVVVGLGLCPFAAPALTAGRVRITVSAAANAAELAADLRLELRHLVAQDPGALETTLLVHPRTLRDFEAFNEFLGIADDLNASEGLEGEIQIASFHPDYRFANTDANDLGNWTNRSPHPMLHLLREASVEEAIRTHPNVAGIPLHNVETLERLGLDGLRDVLEGKGSCPDDAQSRSGGGQ